MTAVAAPTTPDLLRIPLAQITAHPANRKRFDPGQLDELARSLQTHGQLTPALVRPIAGGYQLLAGERRFRAAGRAGLDALLCLVRPLDDAAALEVLAIENNQREDVHPLEEADLYKALLTVEGYDVAKIAARLHRSVAYVYDRLKLLQLDKPARKLFLEGSIQVGHAIILARLTKEQQALAIGDEDDWAGRGNGLFEEERTLFHPDQDEDEDGTEPRKAKTPRELQAWVDEHIRFDRASADLPQLFPETSAALAAAGERKLKTVDITHEHYVQPEAREGGKIIGPRSWKRADGQRGSKPCAHQVLGTIAAGPGRGEAFLVCVAKQACTVHWGQEQREAQARARARGEDGATTPAGAAAQPLTAAQKRARVERHEEEDRDRRLGDVCHQLPGLRVLAERLREVSLTPSAPLVKEAANGQQFYQLDAAKVLALVPLGTTPASMLRRMLWVWFLSQWEEDGTYARGAEPLLKGLGLTVPQFLDALGKPALDPTTAWCARCGCTQKEACPGGCSWDPASWKAGEAICTACVANAPAKAPKAGKAKAAKGAKRAAKGER